MMAGPTCMLPRWPAYSREKVQDDDSQICRSVGESSNCDAKARLYLQLRCSDFAFEICLHFSSTALELLQALPSCLCGFPKVWWPNLTQPDSLPNLSSKSQIVDDIHSLRRTKFGGWTLEMYCCRQTLRLEVDPPNCLDGSWWSTLNTAPILDSLVRFVHPSEDDMPMIDWSSLVRSWTRIARTWTWTSYHDQKWCRQEVHDICTHSPRKVVPFLYLW